MIQIRVLQRQQLSYPCYLFGFRDLTNQCAYVHFQHNAFFVIMCRITIKLFLYCQNPFHGEGFLLVMNSFMTLTLCMIMLSYQLWVIWHVHLHHESDVLSWTVRSNVCCHTSKKKIFWPTSWNWPESGILVRCSISLSACIAISRKLVQECIRKRFQVFAPVVHINGRHYLNVTTQNAQQKEQFKSQFLKEQSLVSILVSYYFNFPAFDFIWARFCNK